MCTLLTIDSGTFRARPTAIINQIRRDWIGNSDGFALLILDSEGRWTELRGFAIDLVLDSLYAIDWERIWLHQRFATQGEVSLANCHGWSYRGQIVMHNGTLRAPEARRLPVDSMQIGRWLTNGQLGQKLAREPFANVFVIDTELGAYAVHHAGGTLHTDGLGNYSTEPIPGVIDRPADRGWGSYQVPAVIELDSAFAWSRYA